MLRKVEVWATLWLCEADCKRVKDLLSERGVAKRSRIINRMHLTVYHARRPMSSLTMMSEKVDVVVPTADTRFMVLAPGGENPRPELEPASRKVGIRVQRKNVARGEIQAFRNRLLPHETKEVLGVRRASTSKTNAFGARSFQPHIAILRVGSGVDRDLTKLGTIFRREITSLRFDRFSIDVVLKDPWHPAPVRKYKPDGQELIPTELSQPAWPVLP